MHPLYQKANELTGEIIAAAIEVHRTMGPGLVESIYEWCLIKELELRGLPACNQKRVLVHYKGFEKEELLRCDVLVSQCVLVELKAVEEVHPVHKAMLLSYMKLFDATRAGAQYSSRGSLSGGNQVSWKSCRDIRRVNANTKLKETSGLADVQLESQNNRSEKREQNIAEGRFIQPFCRRVKLLDIPLGLLINFHEQKLTDGISRLILRDADK